MVDMQHFLQQVAAVPNKCPKAEKNRRGGADAPV